MPKPQLPLLVPAALAAALTIYAGVTGTPGPAAQRFIPSEHPAAVLAWVNMRCDAPMALRHDAPRAHPEVLLEVAAAYDQAMRHRPASDVCAEAAVLARSVADERSLPQRQRVAVR